VRRSQPSRPGCCPRQPRGLESGARGMADSVGFEPCAPLPYKSGPKTTSFDQRVRCRVSKGPSAHYSVLVYPIVRFPPAPPTPVENKALFCSRMLDAHSGAHFRSGSGRSAAVYDELTLAEISGDQCVRRTRPTLATFGCVHALCYNELRCSMVRSDPDRQKQQWERQLRCWRPATCVDCRRASAEGATH
jgi:hypothetical protein